MAWSHDHVKVPTHPTGHCVLWNASSFFLIPFLLLALSLTIMSVLVTTPPHQVSRKRLQFADEEGAERRVSPEKRLASASCSRCGQECPAERFRASDGCEGRVVTLYLCDACADCPICSARMTRTDELVRMEPDGRVVCIECCFWCVPCQEHHELLDKEDESPVCPWRCRTCDLRKPLFECPSSGRWCCAQCLFDDDNGRSGECDDDDDSTIEYGHDDDQ